MKKILNKNLVLTPSKLSGDINIAENLGRDGYLTESEYGITFICSDLTRSFKISVKFEPIEKILDGDNIPEYRTAGNDDRLIHIGDTEVKSQVTLLNGTASTQLSMQAVKRFQFTAIPTSGDPFLPNSTLTINID